MKTVLSTIVVSLLLLSSTIFGSASTYTMGTNPMSRVFLTAVTAVDTLAGTGDSMTIVSKYAFPSGFMYRFMVPKLSGTALASTNDSVKGYLRYDWYENDALVGSTFPGDTISSGKISKTIVLPMFTLDGSSQVTIKFITIAGHGGQVLWPANKTFIRQCWFVTK